MSDKTKVKIQRPFGLFGKRNRRHKRHDLIPLMWKSYGIHCQFHMIFTRTQFPSWTVSPKFGPSSTSSFGYLIFEIAIKAKHCSPPSKLAILLILHVSFTKITKEVLVGIKMMNIMHITWNWRSIMSLFCFIFFHHALSLIDKFQ